MRKPLAASLFATALALAACGGEKAPPAPTAADADAFIASVNAELRKDLPLLNSAAWLQSTYITSDSQAVATKFNEEFLADQARWVQQAKKFQGVEGLSPDTARALQLLKNANVSSGMVLPSCQDTGTAIVIGKKGQDVWTDGTDEAAISEGVHRTYTETSRRESTAISTAAMAPPTTLMIAPPRLPEIIGHTPAKTAHGKRTS